MAKGDIGIFLLEDNSFDLKIESGDLKGDAGLETAVTISLFTDKRVTDEELPQGQVDKRGFWGDMFPEVDRDQIGSRLWTLEREKRTEEVLRKYEDYSQEALKWMLEDGVASAITAEAVYNEFKHLILTIVITKPNGRDFKFIALWDEQKVIRG